MNIKQRQDNTKALIFGKKLGVFSVCRAIVAAPAFVGLLTSITSLEQTQVLNFVHALIFTWNNLLGIFQEYINLLLPFDIHYNATERNIVIIYALLYLPCVPSMASFGRQNFKNTDLPTQLRYLGLAMFLLSLFIGIIIVISVVTKAFIDSLSEPIQSNEWFLLSVSLALIFLEKRRYFWVLATSSSFIFTLELLYLASTFSPSLNGWMEHFIVWADTLPKT